MDTKASQPVHAGFSHWRKNAGEACGLLWDRLRAFPGEFSQKTPQQKTKTVLMGTAAVGACFASALIPGSQAMVSGGWMVAAQLLGFGAYGLSLVLPSLGQNRHVLALQPAVGYTIATQKVLLGGAGYAIMAGIAATRAMILSFIPEDRTKLRRGIALGFWGVGIGTIGTVAAFTSLWNAAPILSMTLGTVADTVKSENTRYARALRMIANANNTVYSLLFSHSVSGTFMDATSSVNLARNINKFDVPKASPDSAAPAPTFLDRVGLYARQMLTFKPVPEFYPQPVVRGTEMEDIYTPASYEAVPTPVRSQEPSGPSLKKAFDGEGGLPLHEQQRPSGTAPGPTAHP